MWIQKLFSISERFRRFQNLSKGPEFLTKAIWFKILNVRNRKAILPIHRVVVWNRPIDSAASHYWLFFSQWPSLCHLFRKPYWTNFRRISRPKKPFLFTRKAYVYFLFFALQCSVFVMLIKNIFEVPWVQRWEYKLHMKNQPTIWWITFRESKNYLGCACLGRPFCLPFQLWFIAAIRDVPNNLDWSNKSLWKRLDILTSKLDLTYA